MRRILIPMSESVLYRLAVVAEQERRDPRQQAAYMLERALGITNDQLNSLNTRRDAEPAREAAGVSL
jgi:hypothetical protein